MANRQVHGSRPIIQVKSPWPRSPNCRRRSEFQEIPQVTVKILEYCCRSVFFFLWFPDECDSF